MRAYSAGGVVFRLAPLPTLSPQPLVQSAEKQVLGDQQNTDEAHHLALAYSEVADPEDGQGDIAQGMEVVLVGRSHAGIWALPKGTPKPGETTEQVAIREVQEETGLQVRIVTYIGSISYTFVRTQVRYHKQVRHFLMEPIGGDIALHDHEYDLVAWFPLAEACRRLTFQNEVNILYQAEETLQRWLQYRRREG